MCQNSTIPPITISFSVMETTYLNDLDKSSSAEPKYVYSGMQKCLYKQQKHVLKYLWLPIYGCCHSTIYSDSTLPMGKFKFKGKSSMNL